MASFLAVAAVSNVGSPLSHAWQSEDEAPRSGLQSAGEKAALPLQSAINTCGERATSRAAANLVASPRTTSKVDNHAPPATPA